MMIQKAKGRVNGGGCGGPGAHPLPSPIITLNGNSSLSVEKGDTYTDAGATALDNSVKDITSSIVVVNPVDMTTPGTYTITYNVKDASENNAAQVTRTVIVVDTTAPVKRLHFTQ